MSNLASNEPAGSRTSYILSNVEGDTLLHEDEIKRWTAKRKADLIKPVMTQLNGLKETNGEVLPKAHIIWRSSRATFDIF